MEAVPVEDTFITGDGDQQTRALVNDGSSFDNLDKSDHYYTFLFDGNPFPGWIYNLETLQFVDVNDAAVEFYGYSKQEFLSMKLRISDPGENSLRRVRKT